MTGARPSLGTRAVSDMAPLVSPAPDANKNEISRGTHAVHGGARVSSGKRMVLGGMAPMSPFLPLPPAPTADELRRQCHPGSGQHQQLEARHEPSGGVSQGQEGHLLGLPDSSQRRASVNDVQAHRPRVEAKKVMSEPAPFMIRSYSMPVATQRDFDAQQLHARLHRQRGDNWTPEWSMSRTSSSSTAKDAPRSPLRTFRSGETNGHLTRSMSRSAHSSTDANARQDAKWDLSNLTGDGGSTSSSDETDDVSTPRAVSPVVSSISTDLKDDSSVPAVIDLHIHPDHLQPPPVWATS